MQINQIWPFFESLNFQLGSNIFNLCSFKFNTFYAFVSVLAIISSLKSLIFSLQERNANKSIKIAEKLSKFSEICHLFHFFLEYILLNIFSKQLYLLILLAPLNIELETTFFIFENRDTSSIISKRLPPKLCASKW